jgi:CHAD domain-containing protein
MAYRLKRKKRLTPEIRRVARKEIQRAIEHLRKQNASNGGEFVHEARKNLKKERALVRLIRENLGNKRYKKENGSLRNIAQGLSPRRDAEVLLNTLRKFRSAHGMNSLTPALIKLRKTFVKQEKSASRQVSRSGKKLDKELKAARRRVKDWRLGKIKKTDLWAGIHTAYKRGRKAFMTAREESSPENLHEWRKRVKDLGYHFDVIECFCSKELKGVAEDLSKLGDHLGDDHDLVMLGMAARSDSLTEQEINEISKSIVASRKSLQKAAFKLGEAVYAEKPKEFLERLRKCWKG